MLVPTYHCPTIVAPVCKVGAEPLFYPITERGQPDVKWLETHADRAAAFIVPHLFGLPSDLQEIRNFCDRRGIALIEDCAHAFFGYAGDRPVGEWGDVVTASFTKFFPGEGGLLLLRAEGLEEPRLGKLPFLSELRAVLDTLEVSSMYGGLGPFNQAFHLLFELKVLLRMRAGVAGLGQVKDVTDCLPEELIDMPASRAACWLMRTARVDRLIARRRGNYALLVELLANVPGVTPFCAELPATSVPYVCPILVNEADSVYRRLREDRIPVFRWDQKWPTVPRIEDDAATRWSRDLLQVACHQDLSTADMRLIAARIDAHVRASVRRE